MKFIGNQIYQWISRFRNDVYLEDLATSTEQSYLVVDSEGKITKRTTLNSGSNDITTTGNVNSTNVIITGEIRGPATTVIDPAPVGDNNGVLQIKGDLQVDGTTTTINSTTLTVDDKNIVLSSGSTTSLASDGAGITIDGASATLTYAHSDTSWNFNKNLNIDSPALVAGTTLNINNNYGESNKSITFTHNNGVTEVAKICAYGRANNAIPPYFLIKVNDTVSGGSNTTSSSDRIKIQSDGTFMFNTVGGDEKIRITSDGFLGVGTASPSAMVHAVSPDGNTHSLKLGRGDNSSDPWFFNHAGNDLRIYNPATSGSDILLGVDAGGSVKANSVGIGTATPDQKLDVQGNIQISSTDTTDGNTIGYLNFHNTTGGASGNHARISAIRDSNSAGQLAFHTKTGGASHERMRINSSGNVGIGVTNPAEKLTVGGNVRIASSDPNLIIADTNGRSVEIDVTDNIFRIDDVGNNAAIFTTDLSTNPTQTTFLTTSTFSRLTNFSSGLNFPSTSSASTSLVNDNCDISTWKLAFEKFSITTEETAPEAIFFKSDGTKMYIMGRSGDDINEYALSTAWDVTTASFDANDRLDGLEQNAGGTPEGDQESNPYGMYISPNGLQLFIVGHSRDRIIQYTMSTAWDISTATYTRSSTTDGEQTGTTLLLKADGSVYTNPVGIHFKSDGTALWVCSYDQDTIQQYTLSDAFDVSTISVGNSFSLIDFFTVDNLNPGKTVDIGSIEDLFFSEDGKKVWIVDSSFDTVHQLDLSTAYNITTATYAGRAAPRTTPYQGDAGGIYVNETANKAFTVSSSGDTVRTYDIGGLVVTNDNKSGTGFKSSVNISESLTVNKSTNFGGPVYFNNVAYLYSTVNTYTTTNLAHANGGTVNLVDGTTGTGTGVVDALTNVFWGRNSSDQDVYTNGPIQNINLGRPRGGGIVNVNIGRRQSSINTPLDHTGVVNIVSKAQTFTHDGYLTIGEKLQVVGNADLQVYDLGGSVIFNDTFTETNTTALENHTPDTGVGWSKVFDSRNGAGAVWNVEGGTGLARTTVDDSSDGLIYVCDTLPSTVDYEIKVDFQRRDNGDDTFHIILKYKDENNFFDLMWSASYEFAELRKKEAGTFSVIEVFDYGVMNSVDSSLATSLKVRYIDNKIMVWDIDSNGFQAFRGSHPVTDFTNDGEGGTFHKFGMGLGAIDGGTHDLTNEWHVDKFEVKELSSAATLKASTKHYIENGSVGIGTTNPSQKLEVLDGFISSGGSGTSHGFELKRDSLNTYQIRHLDGGLTIFNQTDTRKEMTFDGAGNVGIGTNSPAHKLVVLGGNIQTDGIVYSNTIRDNTGGNVSIQDNGGNVGIGTASPDSLLEISSDSVTDFLKLTSTSGSADPIKLIFEKSSTEQGIIEYNRNGDFEIYNNDSDGGVMIDGSASAGADFYVANDGNVGIGTSSPANALDVVTGNNVGVRFTADPSTQTWRDIKFVNAVQETQAASFDDHSHIYTTTTANGTNWPFTEYGALVIEGRDNTNSGIAFRTGDGSGQVTRLAIRESGNIGIGTVSPEFPLDIKGAVNALQLTNSDYSSGSAGSRIRFTFGSSTGNTFAKIQTTDVGGISASNLILQSDSGFVGVGTDSPGSIMEVNGGSADGLKITAGNAAGEFALNASTSNGTSRLWVGGTGNVGINTVTPHNKTHIVSTSSGDGLLIDCSNGSNNNFTGVYFKIDNNTTNAYKKGGLVWERTGSYNEGRFHFLLNNEDNVNNVGLSDSKMTILSTGNVGVGTTTPSNKLDVVGDVKVHSTGSGNNATLFIDTVSGGNADSILNFREGTVDRASLYWDGGDNDLYLTTTTGDFLINPSGSVGIGDTSPDRKLSINGDGIRVDNGSSSAVLELYSSNNWRLQGANSFVIYDVTSNHTPFTVEAGAGNNTLVLDSLDRVGMGTNAPQQKLDVNGNVRSNGLIINSTFGASKVTFTPTTNDKYEMGSNETKLNAMPFPLDFHDVLSFGRNYTITQEISTDGTSFSSMTLEGGVFDMRTDNSVRVIDGSLSTEEQATRYIISNVAYVSATFLKICFTFSSPAASVTVTVETCSDGTFTPTPTPDDGSGTITQRHTSTVSSASSKAVYFYLDYHGADTHMRITLDKGNNTDNKNVNVSSIQLLTRRHGDQGQGPEYNLPFDWDYDRNITAPKNLTITNGSLTIPEYIYHGGDTTNYRRFLTNRQTFVVGNSSSIDLNNGVSTFGHTGGATTLQGSSLAFTGNATFANKVIIPQTSTTISGSNLDNASLLIGSSSAGIGIDKNEIVSKGDHLYIGAATNDKNIYLRTDASSNVLTLDSSQNATFAGNVSIDNASATSQLFLRGTGNDFVNAAVVLESQDDDGHYRGAGVYMNNVVGATEWFAGRPYQDGDSYQILRRHTTSGNHNNNTAHSSATNTDLLLDMDNSGNTTFTGTLTVNGADAITISDYILHAGDGNSKFGFPSNDNFKVRLNGSDVFTMSETAMAFAGDLTVNGGDIYLALSGSTQRAVASTGTNSLQVGDAGVQMIRFKNAAGNSLDIAADGDATFAGNLTVNGGTVILNSNVTATGTMTASSYKISSATILSGSTDVTLGSGGSTGTISLTTHTSTPFKIEGDDTILITSQIKATDGTSSAPAYTFNGFTDDGIYREVYDTTKTQINFATEGSRRLRINEAGIFSDANVYFLGDLRTFGSLWHATTGTSGAGFEFKNTADNTVALTLSSTGNAAFGGNISGADGTFNGVVTVNSATENIPIELLSSDSGCYIRYNDGDTSDRWYVGAKDGSFRFHNNSNTSVLTLSSNENATFTGSVTCTSLIPSSHIFLGATKYLYFDGGGNTHIRESSADTLQITTGGTLALTLNSSQNATFAGDITVSGGDITLGGTGRIQGVDTVSIGTDAANKTYVDNQVSAKTESFILACSDETTDLTASSSVAKVTFRMPYAFTLTNVRANVNTATEGSAITVDIKRSGTSIFSTALTIANGSKTSVGGTVHEFAGNADTMELADDAEITIFCTAVGSTSAGKGLKVTLIGNQ